MDKTWIDQAAIKQSLSSFFQEKKTDFSKFGQTVNQTFEAFVFISVVEWYKSHGWDVSVVHAPRETKRPGKVQLKFSTRGKPDNYTYFKCKKGNDEIQVRHQLRVATRSYTGNEFPPANICLDVAVIKSIDLSAHQTDDFVKNEHLVTFGEAKHMSAFAELLASFIGLVHELKPDSLKRHSKRLLQIKGQEHLSPFLYVSGLLYRTASGIKKTIENRGYNVSIYNRTESMTGGTVLPTVTPNKGSKGKKASK